MHMSIQSLTIRSINTKLSPIHADEYIPQSVQRLTLTYFTNLQDTHLHVLLLLLTKQNKLVKNNIINNNNNNNNHQELTQQPKTKQQLPPHQSHHQQQLPYNIYHWIIVHN